jgi:hypothetical protein
MAAEVAPSIMGETEPPPISSSGAGAPAHRRRLLRSAPGEIRPGGRSGVEAPGRWEGQDASGEGGGAREAASARSDADIAAEAAKGFELFQCDQCAAAVVAALKREGRGGKILTVRTVDSAGGRSLHNIFSDGLGIVISGNGFHQAVQVGDLVFDNLHPDGIPCERWLEDLHAPFGYDVTGTPFRGDGRCPPSSI